MKHLLSKKEVKNRKDIAGYGTCLDNCFATCYGGCTFGCGGGCFGKCTGFLS